MKKSQDIYMFENYENKYIHFNDILYDSYVFYKKDLSQSDSWIEFAYYIGMYLHNNIAYVSFNNFHTTEKKYLKTAQIMENQKFEHTIIQLLFTHEVDV